MILNEEYAMFEKAFPCNPHPFLNRIKELCKSDYGKIKSNKVKACLFILNVLAYEQLFKLDSMDEYIRLYEILKDRDDNSDSKTQQG